MAEEAQEIDLAALSDEELTEQMHNDLYDGMAAEITAGTNILLGRGWSPDRTPSSMSRRRRPRAGSPSSTSCSAAVSTMALRP